MCFVEQKTFSVILRIFLTNAPPLWFPLYSGLQICWRWQFLLKIDWGVWLKFLYRFKDYYNVFRGTENIFCDITYFPHKCATFVVPFVFWFTKTLLTLTIFMCFVEQNHFLRYYEFSSQMRMAKVRWGVWLKFLYRFKVLL